MNYSVDLLDLLCNEPQADLTTNMECLKNFTTESIGSAFAEIILMKNKSSFVEEKTQSTNNQKIESKVEEFGLADNPIEEENDHNFTIYSRNNSIETSFPVQNPTARKISPYHNYQKHLVVALKHLVLLPKMTLNSEVEAYLFISQRLWASFVRDEKSTKRYLHFIFNEANQIPISDAELETLGLADLYHSYSHDDLIRAKQYLTRLTISLLENNRVDSYLESRRIKNKRKFKAYLMNFKKELEEGFIRKRFTNKSSRRL